MTSQTLLRLKGWTLPGVDSLGAVGAGLRTMVMPPLFRITPPVSPDVSGSLGPYGNLYVLQDNASWAFLLVHALHLHINGRVHACLIWGL